jgi:hypothetical protein
MSGSVDAGLGGVGASLCSGDEVDVELSVRSPIDAAYSSVAGEGSVALQQESLMVGQEVSVGSLSVRSPFFPATAPAPITGRAGSAGSGVLGDDGLDGGMDEGVDGGSSVFGRESSVGEGSEALQQESLMVGQEVSVGSLSVTAAAYSSVVGEGSSVVLLQGSLVSGQEVSVEVDEGDEDGLSIVLVSGQ